MTTVNTSGRRRERWLILKNGSCDLSTNRLVMIPESTCHLDQAGGEGGRGRGQTSREVMIKHSSEFRLSFLQRTENHSFYDITARRLSSMYVCAHLQGGTASHVFDNPIYSWTLVFCGPWLWAACNPFPLGLLGRNYSFSMAVLPFSA